MKKFSADYFEKKYTTLFQKLLMKDGFSESVRKTRTELGLPIEGFDDEVRLANFFINKMSKKQLQSFQFKAFVDDYIYKNKIEQVKENKEIIINAFLNEYEKKDSELTLFAIATFAQELLDHNAMLTRYVPFEENKYLSQLFPKTLDLIRKFWSLDLLDEHIIGHFVEKYLFLNEYGIKHYIRQKIRCTNCRYIGVNHFSPDRDNMQGRDQGVYSDKYIFNRATVKQLSLHFNSVFLIIKPYATKEEALNYIEDNWNDLKKHLTDKNTFYKQFDVHPGKIKESDFERNNLIYELYKLPKKELIKMYKGERNLKGVGIYKEMVISAILNEEHGIEMTSDAIKKTATRFAKSAKVERWPKDIGDI